jgi:hypothetical protein
MGSIRNKDYEFTAFTKLDWMRARGYSEKQIEEYLKRREKKQKAGR